MARLRFSVPNAQDFDAKVWETAYITGLEGIPWFCEHSLVDDQFSIGRQIDESGKLNIVWPSRTLGNVCLSTTSLRVGEETYSLPIEIARGTVHRLKSLSSEWQRVGMRLPDSFYPLAEQSLSELLCGLTSHGDRSEQTDRAQRSIDLALQASIDLCEAFSLQALDARRKSEGRLSTLLGCRLEKAIPLPRWESDLRTAFNLISVPAELGLVESASGNLDFAVFDQQVDWAANSDQKVCVGPLIDFRDGRLPEWMLLLNESFDSVLQTACRHAQQTVERYRGRVHLWNCAAGINVPNKHRWSDEQILRLAVSIIETVRRIDDRAPTLLTIDQPWSEYLRNDANGISPLHFADALIRADLGLSGLCLELNFDAWPGGTLPRDPIEISRLIDRWSMLGLPLMIVLTNPTEAAIGSNMSQVTGWRTPESSGHIEPETIVRLLLAKPAVHAILWNQLSDGSDETGCSRGLWTSDGQAKPLLSNIADLRKNYLH